MKTKHILFALAGSGIVLLNGCMSVGPDYEQPETPMPDAWHVAVQEEFGSGEPDLQTWWTVFGDETLNGLIIEYMETIPESGVSVSLHGYRLEIIKRDKNTIKLVKFYPEK